MGFFKVFSSDELLPTAKNVTYQPLTPEKLKKAEAKLETLSTSYDILMRNRDIETARKVMERIELLRGTIEHNRSGKKPVCLR